MTSLDLNRKEDHKLGDGWVNVRLSCIAYPGHFLEVLAISILNMVLSRAVACNRAENEHMLALELASNYKCIPVKYPVYQI